MAEIVALSILIAVPAAIAVGIMQLLTSAWSWYRQRQETIHSSRYDRHIALSRLADSERRAKQQQAVQRVRDKKEKHRIQQIGKQLQLAFMQLPDAPDAQRLMSWSKIATELPVSFRRRQFGRFRELLAEQIPRWISTGIERESLAEHLRAIVRNLGVAPFEADYLVAEMSPVVNREDPSSAEQFETQLAEIHAEHQRRRQSIDAIEGLDGDVREELLEAEDQRYRQMLFGHRSR